MSRRWWVLALAVVAVQVAVELAMGRSVICPCGTVQFWGGDAWGSGTSQHVADWYTPSHVIHGFLFYGLLWLVARRWPVTLRLVAALAIEGAWEIAENTPWVIQHYRDATASRDYAGDSVLNSVFDSVWMAAGFFVAWRLPAWITVVLAVAMEVAVGWVIRDNLTLNVLMFVWPVDGIRNWQTAAQSAFSISGISVVRRLSSDRGPMNL